MLSSHENTIRREQLTLGRRRVENTKPVPAPTEEKRQSPKGHDAILKYLQETKQPVTLIKTSGEVVTGLITGRDQFTITVMCDKLKIRRVFYKHAVEEFYGDKPATAVQ